MHGPSLGRKRLEDVRYTSSMDGEYRAAQYACCGAKNQHLKPKFGFAGRGVSSAQHRVAQTLIPRARRLAVSCGQHHRNCGVPPMDSSTAPPAPRLDWAYFLDVDGT